MRKTGLLPSDGDLLDYCTINNLVKCAGSEGSGNYNAAMRQNCFHWYMEEMRNLSPDIIVFLGDKARDADSLAGVQRVLGHSPLVVNLPHPAFYPHIWKKHHPPRAGSKWDSRDETQRYKDCLALRDLVKDAVERMKNDIERNRG